MAKSVLEMIFGTAIKQVVRTATRNVTNNKTSGRWECPACGVMKAPQAAKHEVNGGLICTKCKVKHVKV